MKKETQLKEAFKKIKQDIDSLRKENNLFMDSLLETRGRMSKTINLIKNLTEINLRISGVLEELKNKQQKEEVLGISTNFSTHQYINPTHSTDIIAQNPQISGISIGNEGGPTDRQTDQQTDRLTDKDLYNTIKPTTNSIDESINIFDSLDNLKKEIRLKFKKLTEQELLVFSTVYQLEEEQGYVTYKSISNKLNLTESSIRDYIGKLIKKGIPINKNKINNKNIQISISKNLKKIASLQTILHLRDL